MLELRGYKEDEIQQIKDILIKEKINDRDLNGIIVVVVEDNIVLGLCKVEIIDSNSWLKYLVIKEDSRGENLGDGLLRTVLNKLDLKEIKMIFYDYINLYLIKKGFVENPECKLELNISEFFKGGCKCPGQLNEI